MSSPAGAGGGAGARPGDRGAVPADRVDPHPGRLDPGRGDYDRIVAAHRRAVAAGAPSYLDPATGLTVLSAVFLWERGTCCDSGCRHCPYVARVPPPAGSGSAGR